MLFVVASNVASASADIEARRSKASAPVSSGARKLTRPITSPSTTVGSFVDKVNTAPTVVKPSSMSTVVNGVEVPIPNRSLPVSTNNM